MSFVILQIVPSSGLVQVRRPAFASAYVLFLSLFVASAPALCDEIAYSITGIDEPLLANVLSHVRNFGLGGSARITPGQLEQTVTDATMRARDALKPYGYYHPEIQTNIVEAGDQRWRLNMRIDPGPPVRVRNVNIDIRGPGSGLGELKEWRSDWPLTSGTVLDQTKWQQQKQQALEIARSMGYLSAKLLEHSLKLDLVNNRADLSLVLETGPQAVFGGVEFVQNEVDPGVLANIPRFEPGSPYQSSLVSKLRLDLWQTGYFTDIEVAEKRHLKATPPTVDLVAKLATRTRNIYEGTIGYGTDTGIRAQASWSRHPLTSNGDGLELGIGYQELDDEFTVRGHYRLPRRTHDRQFWVSTVELRRDKQDLEVKRNEDDENFVTLAPGNVDDLFFRFGRLHIRNRKQGRQQYFETMFVQYLRESYAYDPGPDADPEILNLVDDPQFSSLFSDTIRTLAIGMEWDRPVVTGSGFATVGHRERAWLFTSNEAWGSDREFTQVYLSTRRSHRKGERWKFLLRAEAGYTDADVDKLVFHVDGDPIALSLTALPNHYRFKAGGSNSVRGYGFEELSNNDIGSNNILTASAEVEFKILESWSVAAFFDVGNAFNDWNDFELRSGAGIGIRWYTIAGAIRLDFARALDVEGHPWRLHFTIGTPLL